MSSAARPRPFLRLRGRSFMAMVLTPEPPLAGWTLQLDGQLARSPRFFDGRPVVVDFAALAGQEAEFTGLLDSLAARAIRVIGIEGVDEEALGPLLLTLPPVIAGGRTVGLPVLVADAPADDSAPPVPPEPVHQPEPPPAALVLDRPVRSGQSVAFTTGDVTVIGSVASGSEVIAGGSIHVYGTLRGRAIAGLLGPGPDGRRPRIFCRRLEAELLAIDGVYKTADEMDPALQGRAVQVWLDGDELAIAALD
ncbi:MAG: septum site-determining protein MinC [Janthinobacterium lividum]